MRHRRNPNERNAVKKLTGIEKRQAGDVENLQLTWQSLDSKIDIVTIAPAVDSAQYIIGVIYARCFLKR